MRAFFVLFTVLGLVSSAGAEVFDPANAPKDFLGYAFGTPEAAVTDAVKAAGKPYTAVPAKTVGGESKLVLTKQTVDRLENATVELAFQGGVLFRITATLPYSADAAQGLRDVLADKYGKVKSVDGGYRYNWFFGAAGQAAGALPEFALILNVDAVAKSIRLVYADNAVKTKPGPAATAAVPTPSPSPTAPLNPANF